MKKYVAVLPSHKLSQHFPFIVFIFFFVRLRQNWASCLSRFKSQGIIMCGLFTESSPSPPAPSLTPHPLP